MSAMQQSLPFTAPGEPPRRRNLVIEAGAGTGKTTAIAGEVIRLMLDDPTLAPERIVLMTFTEKAAGEIADRIRGGLEHLHASLDDPSAVWPPKSARPLVRIDDANRERARLALARHLPRIDALRSQTIHSFCQSLLRTFPIEAGLDPQFKIIEGFERALFYSQLYDEWVDQETRTDPSPAVVRQWELLFAHSGYLFLVRSLILSLAERRDLLQDTGYGFGDVLEIDAGIRETISVIRQSDEHAKDEDAERVLAYVRTNDPPPPASEADSLLDAWIGYLEPIAGAMLDANLKGLSLLAEAIRFFRTDKDKGTSLHEVLVNHRASMAAIAMTRRFVEFVDAEKRRQGLVDFDDLLLRTLSVLGDPAVLERARAQFDYIFVDEFQDTDRVQARIIEALAKDASGTFVPGRTVVVGDPKQSIYGFRRADPETYYQITKALVDGGAEQRLITEQYRSDPPLLDAVNAMFECLFPPQGHDPNVFRPEYRRLTAARPEAARELDARFTLLRTCGDDSANRYFSEAKAIAEWIGARRDGSDKDLQRFAILFRRLTALDDYLDTLERYRIDYVLPPTRMFLDRRAPVDLLAVLRAIAFPYDRGALISAARTPYFGLTDDEIAAGVLGVAPEPWATFVQSIAGFREASRHLTVSGTIDRVVEAASIEQLYRASADGGRNLRHLDHMRRIAFEYDQRSGGSIRQFVDEITERREDPDEMEPSLVDESSNAVRILTVHAAKGLEFDTVIIPDLSFDSSGAQGNVQFFTVEEPRSFVLGGRVESISGRFRKAGGEAIRKIASHRADAEMRRLFYVAVTRAKSEVVFVCNEDEKTQSRGFLKCLLEPFGLKWSAAGALWPGEEGRIVHEMELGGTTIPVAAETVAVRDAAARVRARLRDEALERALSQGELVPAEIATTSPPALLSRGEVAARRAGSRSRTAGVLLHRVLEVWDGSGDVEPLLRTLAVESGADAEIVERVRRRLATVARSETCARLRRAEPVGRELPLRFRDEHGLVVERRIDRLVRENGLELVVDYKSGAPDPDRLEKDREQVTRYCRAIAALTGRPCTGLLWYIDLERDQAVEVPSEAIKADS